MEDFRRLFKYLRPNLPLFAVAFVAMILVALFETAIGALMVPLLDQFQMTKTGTSATLFRLHEFIPKDDWWSAWVMIAGMVISFTFLKGIAAYFSVFLMGKIGQSAVLSLRKDLYSHILSQPASFFQKNRTNFLVSRLVVSCASIEQTVSNNIRDLLREGLMIIFFVSAAFYFNWRLMLIALLLGPIVAILTSRFSKALRKLAEVSLKGNQAMTDTAQEAISNQTIVKSYHAEKSEERRFGSVAETIARAQIRSVEIASIAGPLLELIGNIAIVGLFYFGLREINAGTMEPAQFFVFIFFLLRSYDPIRKISRQHNEISKGIAAARDIWEVMDIDESLPVPDKPVQIKELKDRIALKDVSFGYDDGEGLVLEGINIEVKAGETVALVGESGSGKSSLIKLLQRQYDPDSGAIEWDGTDLKLIEPVSLNRQFALVTQETVLFNDTINYNISYGKPGATQEEIAKAASIAFADIFIDELTNGYDTLVGEKGTFLSGGQKQRVAIARAVLVDATVLVLDEATSALDSESENFVKQALENLMVNRTSVVIAHRISTVRKADRIYVLDKGRVTEQGTHRELLELGRTYKRLYTLQFAEEDDGDVLNENQDS
ncbi:MAG: ATP-binding cassette domain-containing protein [Pyrinomonadaceae bacterium]|nr:ATP-binding cassette domain-containing protein [Pyrinomonadaceae bacterium]